MFSVIKITSISGILKRHVGTSISLSPWLTLETTRFSHIKHITARQQSPPISPKRLRLSSVSLQNKHHRPGHIRIGDDCWCDQEARTDGKDPPELLGESGLHNVAGPGTLDQANIQGVVLITYLSINECN